MDPSTPIMQKREIKIPDTPEQNLTLSNVSPRKILASTQNKVTEEILISTPKITKKQPKTPPAPKRKRNKQMLNNNISAYQVKLFSQISMFSNNQN